MIHKVIVICLAVLSAVALVSALTGKPHEFSENACNTCHVNVETDPKVILPDVTNACGKCHSTLEQIQSHPTDIYPVSSIPEDMPLIDGRLTCLTCHYAHPDKKRQRYIARDFFLRRPYKGPAFCSTCHIIDENKHIIFKKVHMGSFEEKSRRTRIDMESLTCIECHDAHISRSSIPLGAGIWKHGAGARLPHPVGISYIESRKRKKRGLKPAGMLRKEVKLFDGKIGCGSCHNVYSKEKYMLVISNERSTLCLECHVK